MIEKIGSEQAKEAYKELASRTIAFIEIRKTKQSDQVSRLNNSFLTNFRNNIRLYRKFFTQPSIKLFGKYRVKLKDFYLNEKYLSDDYSKSVKNEEMLKDYEVSNKFIDEIEKYEHRKQVPKDNILDFIAVVLGFEGALDAIYYNYDITRKNTDRIIESIKDEILLLQQEQNTDLKLKQGEEEIIDETIFEKNLLDFYKDFPEQFKKHPNSSLVKESIRFNINNYQEESPLFVPKPHLKSNYRWKNQAFSILTLLKNPLRIEQFLMEGKPHFQLQVDLNGEDFGIYNNRGKRFLSEYFKNELSSISRKMIAQSFEDFISKPHNLNQIEKRFPPFRWASGGALPIANFKGKDWVVLSFRDIEPIGWNIPNGASENVEEHSLLNKIIYREFAEEVSLFSSNPYEEGNYFPIQKRFYKADWVQQDPLRSEEFYQKQHALRMEHDQLHLSFTDSVQDRVKVRSSETPFSVKVGKDTFEDVIFSINPHEFGIEVIRVLKFYMNNTDYILDGEMHESEKFLLRRPVMLLSLDYLKEIFDANQSLGDKIDSKTCFDGKALENIPKDCFHIFNADLQAKKKRMNEINKYTSKEKSFYSNWLDQYEKPFSKIVNEKDESIADITSDINPLNFLCPVSWKSIERAIEKGII